MLSQTEAIIHLADLRGCMQSDWYRSYHTFNFDSYFSEHRKPFQDLVAFNDITLKATHTIKRQATQDIMVLLIPVVGGLQYGLPERSKDFIEVEESIVFYAQKGSEYEISNPFEDELINFIEIWVSPSKFAETGKAHFDLTSGKN